MKKIALIAAAAALVLVSCSKGEEGQGATGNTVEFRTVVDKTKASLIDTKDELKSFFVQAATSTETTTFNFLNAAVYADGTNWTYSPKKYWPSTGTVSFYAYAPIKDKNMTSPMANASGTVTFGYTVPVAQNASNTATDLLVASATGLNTGTVPFTFAHALSAVTFSAANLNDATSELVYTISAVKIVGLDNVGTYTYGTGWTSAGTDNVTYLAGLPASGVAVLPAGTTPVYVSLLSPNDYMMVLPQNAAAKNVTITYSLKSGDGQDIYKNASLTLPLPTGFKFEAGKCYDLQFSFSASNAIVLNVENVTGWGTPVVKDIDLP